MVKKCIICGDVSNKILHVGRMVWKCSQCKHVWVDITQEELDDFHQTKKRTWQYKDFPVRDQYIKTRKGLILGAKKKVQSVLDVGCGDCSFLNSFDAKRRLGLDIDPRIEVPEGLEVQFYHLFEFKTDETFDLVSSFHSLEHMTNCVGMFKKLVMLSKWRIAIEVPVYRRLTRHSGHVHSFTDASLMALVRRLSGKVKTICWKRNIQGKSMLWVGERT